MAEGYARITGKPGVCIVTSGPGATNMSAYGVTQQARLASESASASRRLFAVTPIADALMDGTPLVVITGQVSTSVIGTDAFQEAVSRPNPTSSTVYNECRVFVMCLPTLRCAQDVMGMARACTKWCTLLRDVHDLPRAMSEAFAIATSGRPGPVLIDLPKDVAAAKLLRAPDIVPRISNRMREKAAMQIETSGMSPEQRHRIADMINKAERPIIYCGQGVAQAGAVAELRQLAAQGNIPVTTSLLGMGSFDETDPRSLHMLGMHGSVYANYAMQVYRV
jgi:acetolactate synthase I/II/III large subunit